MSTPPRMQRRALLAAAGAAGAALLVPARARAAETALIERAARPMNYETPVELLTTRITPTAQFYIRGHLDLPVVDLASWRIAVDGLVDNPLQLGLAELQRLPQHEVEAVLQCAGNGRALIVPRVPGVQWNKGAVGNAVWRGPRLKDVLERARLRPEGTILELEGADRPVLPTAPRFIRGIPVKKALHDDTVIALQMNGAPLSPAHGFPARLVVPGWVGDDWTKWLGRLTVRAEEPKGFFYETAYRFPAEPTEPGVAPPPHMMRPMDRINVKALIGLPSSEAVLPPGPVRIVGVAFSGEQRIAHVDVSVDGGSFTRARIVEDGGRYGFSVFEHRVALTPGRHTLRARATDASGAVQPERGQWNPSGYLYNAIDAVDVEVRA